MQPHAQQQYRVQRTARSIGVQHRGINMRSVMYDLCVLLYAVVLLTTAPHPEEQKRP